MENSLGCPILMPRKHRLVELLLQEEHVKSLHIGTHFLLSRLKGRFWVLGEKDL